MKKVDLLGELATRSILLEVSTHPKPGLVTPFSPGAHRDMDFTLFLKSTAVLSQGFKEVSHFGYNYKGDLNKMLPPLRKLGLDVEDRMFQVTNGVNTQKGLIFLFYLMLGASGYLLNKRRLSPKNISSAVSKITAGITDKELGTIKKGKKSLSKGENTFLKHGITGIRGEVEKGLPTVMELGLPEFKKAYEKTQDLNKSSLHALIAIMSKAEDTNIISRNGIDVYYNVQKKADEILKVGGVLTTPGMMKIIDMGTDFLKMNISPGGSADLLSATLFLYFIEREV
ncbi:MAG: triphosphoribosyl-dephospho-CoA synthase [Candidatus Methanofastidiosum methylothiophilum]|uniref:Triphosphoribosyl-dephospho-CoA synthase n=1 Tax=Candidatus Methanofastidiosum methylothiophilum TaxID=1705564 RepID=A0A150IHQ3_9EURY|nr:MAG: triphosphoribosyl-dephospho-CoA synthase [Candidatus Methanofastidiosum methylthiophilus]KYC46964.1 MAG: triphosphoribosyl-dephospho-CoA synthase [Candidatus Methanofastidiosum methylthiophilus]KYC50331.1 MAG: triphosphoribosyl-dephospho-CoA synthase [Candidatus Methanofastidiosum methylthiophilus]